MLLSWRMGRVSWPHRLAAAPQPGVSAPAAIAPARRAGASQECNVFHAAIEHAFAETVIRDYTPFKLLRSKNVEEP